MRRREVLRLLACLGLGGLGVPGSALARGRDRTAMRRGSSSEGKKDSSGGSGKPGRRLVVVLLQGGPDGLSLVAPTADPLYAALRPTTALAADAGLDLGDGFRLHPGLAPLFPLWKQGRLAVIPACGLPGLPVDHAGALAWFANGGPVTDKTGRNGWLGRLSLALGEQNGRVVVGSLSPVIVGAPHYNLINPGKGPGLPPLAPEDQALFTAVDRLFDERDGLGKAFAAGRKARGELLAKLLEESRQAASGALPAPAFARFGERLGREMAARRDAGLGFVAVGGFDTHAAQGAARGYLADRLRETAEGIAGLFSGLGQAAQQTVVVALGEFGRRARENTYGGTDNGLGGVMLVAGAPVAGGRRLGVWPGLADHRLAGGRDVAVTTDWRQAVTEIAVRHLGLPEKRLGDIFPGFTVGNAILGLMA